MIPDNELSSEVLKAPFAFPSDKKRGLLEDYELGGIAIQDPSRGLQFQEWYGYWSSGNSTVYIVPRSTTNEPVPLFTVAGVKEFSFTFDQNMRWSTVVRFADGQIQHRWYNAAIEDYDITYYSNIQSAALTLDDKREQLITGGRSDIILTYIDTEGRLCWRNQRDRFGVEYIGYEGIPPKCRIAQCGMHLGLRLQWRITPERSR